MNSTEEREARIAARVAARALRPDLSNAPRCTVKGCSNLLHRAGRCQQHWMPMRRLVGAMAGETSGGITRRGFSEAMSNTSISAHEWMDVADFGAAEEVAELMERATDALFAAGYIIKVGPRGGRYLDRKVQS